MRLTIGILTWNQLPDTKGIWGLLTANTTCKDDIELIVVDQGSTDDTQEFLNRFVFPHWKNHKFIQNKENVGVFKGLNQLWKSTDSEVIALLHNDLYIYEKGWNERILRLFNAVYNTTKIFPGIVGFAGGIGIGENGGRNNVWSNLLEAELHGSRGDGSLKVAMLDGMALICNRKMLEEVGGFDETYPPHHFYDLDISMASINAGYTNWLCGVSCHHRSGTTACRPEYQEWINKLNTSSQGDLVINKMGQVKFMNKWKSKLPIFVG